MNNKCNNCWLMCFKYIVNTILMQPIYLVLLLTHTASPSSTPRQQQLSLIKGASFDQNCPSNVKKLQLKVAYLYIGTWAETSAKCCISLYQDMSGVQCAVPWPPWHHFTPVTSSKPHFPLRITHRCDFVKLHHDRKCKGWWVKREMQQKGLWLENVLRCHRQFNN